LTRGRVKRSLAGKEREKVTHYSKLAGKLEISPALDWEEIQALDYSHRVNGLVVNLGHRAAPRSVVVDVETEEKEIPGGVEFNYIAKAIVPNYEEGDHDGLERDLEDILAALPRYSRVSGELVRVGQRDVVDIEYFTIVSRTVLTEKAVISRPSGSEVWMP
jgi:hypothetical protein